MPAGGHHGHGSQHRSAATGHHEHDRRGERPDEDAYVRMIDLETQVLAPVNVALVGWAATAMVAPLRHVLDLGAGTGAATFALMERFPAARVSAVDAFPVTLARLDQRARWLGVCGQVTTVLADLDQGVPDGGAVDLAWAYSAVKHLCGPERTIAQVGAALAPGGWFVLVESRDVPFFLPHNLGTGRPGLEERLPAASAHHGESPPHMDADRSSVLAAAGLVVREARTFQAADLPAPPLAPVRAHARELLTLLGQASAGRLGGEDVATRGTLLDPDHSAGVDQRDDLLVRTTRNAWTAQRG